MGGLVVLADAIFVEVNGVGQFLHHGQTVPEGLSDQEIADLTEHGRIGVEPVVEEGVVLPEGVPSTAWTVAQIDAYAATRGIGVDARGTKAEKIAAIEAAEAPATGAPVEADTTEGDDLSLVK